FAPLSPTHTYPLSLHDALPISGHARRGTRLALATRQIRLDQPLDPVTRTAPVEVGRATVPLRHLRSHFRPCARDSHSGFVHPLEDRKSTRLNSSHVSISYAVFC